jgi:DNA-binding MarR family transcriptional regulator
MASKAKTSTIRIKEYFEKNPRKEFTPKQISDKLKINKSTTASAIIRLLNGNILLNPKWGVYKLNPKRKGV